MRHLGQGAGSEDRRFAVPKIIVDMPLTNALLLGYKERCTQAIHGIAIASQEPLLRRRPAWGQRKTVRPRQMTRDAAAPGYGADTG